ncbi:MULTISPECIES: nucleoside-diphosphate kinase [unclassified Micromonospora]|uniref:nucleoside-diphosphate kinase n=1 Tax=unclassified Micromonospora TaxID=2617518 RepID=UPI00362D7A3D
MGFMELLDLTRMPIKADLYRQEVYYREARADIIEHLGESAYALIRDGALLMMKPDGLVGGKLGSVCSFVRERGFTVVAVEEVILDACKWREIWRYQLNAASIDRIVLKEALYSARPCLIMLLRSEPGHDVPATVRLSSLKGAADPKNQVSGTLRSLLQQPNRLLSLVHFADEPADLVRELAILFSREERLRLLSSLREQRLSATGEDRLRVALAEDCHPSSSLELAPSVSRAREALRLYAESHPDSVTQFTEIGAALDRVVKGLKIDWRSWKQQIEALSVPVDPWDLIVIGSYSIIADEPGQSKMIGNPPPGAWARAIPQSPSPAGR